MKPVDFQEAVDRLGDDLARWPESLRRQAIELLAAEPAARRILAEAAALRGAMAAAPSSRAPRGLVDRILSAAFDAESAPLSNAVPRKSANRRRRAQAELR